MRRGTCHVRERVVGIRHGPEVMGRVPAEARPAEVIGDPGRLDIASERRKRIQIGLVEGIDGADRQRYPMEHDRVALPNSPAARAGGYRQAA